MYLWGKKPAKERSENTTMMILSLSKKYNPILCFALFMMPSLRTYAMDEHVKTLEAKITIDAIRDKKQKNYNKDGKFLKNRGLLLLQLRAAHGFDIDESTKKP